jgi:hypothetical protein
LLCLKDQRIVEVEWYVPLLSLEPLQPSGSRTSYRWIKGLVGGMVKIDYFKIERGNKGKWEYHQMRRLGRGMWIFEA